MSQHKASVSASMEGENDQQTDIGDRDPDGFHITHWKGKDAESGGSNRISSSAYNHERRQTQQFRLDSTAEVTQMGSELAEATGPLASLMQQFKLNKYQTPYEQEHASHSGSPSSSINPSLYSGQTVKPLDPVVSHLTDGEHQTRNGISIASLQYEGPELIEGETLYTLSVKELVDQCCVRDQLRTLSELHEVKL